MTSNGCLPCSSAISVNRRPSRCLFFSLCTAMMVTASQPIWRMMFSDQSFLPVWGQVGLPFSMSRSISLRVAGSETRSAAPSRGRR